MGEAAEPCALDVADPCALDEEVEHDGHRQGGEVEALAGIAEDAGDGGVDVGGFRGNQGGDERPFGRRADHLAVQNAVVLGHPARYVLARLAPRHAGRPALVLVRVAGGRVVGAWQVVVRQRGQVQYVVVAVLGALGARRLAEGVADEEVRTGQHQVGGPHGKPRLTADGAVTLGSGLVPVAGDAERLAEIAEPSGVGGELPQHGKQGLRVQRGQPHPLRRRTGFLVQLREALERRRADGYHAVGVASGVPLVVVVLDAGNGAAAVVVEAGVHGRGREQVGDVREQRLGTRPAVDVDAEQRLVMNVGEQPLLVLELEVGAQAGVQRRPERAALGRVVHALRVQEAGHAVAAADHPRLGQEALVQVRMLHEQGVVLPGAQEALRRLGLLQLGEPDVAKLRAGSGFRCRARRCRGGVSSRHAGRASGAVRNGIRATACRGSRAAGCIASLRSARGRPPAGAR